MLPPSWEDDTDEFLKSMLTGSDLSGLGVSGSDTVCPSDTSSDSGCPEEQVRTLTSPGLDDGPCYTNAYTPLPSPPPTASTSTSMTATRVPMRPSPPSTPCATPWTRRPLGRQRSSSQWCPTATAGPSK